MHQAATQELHNKGLDPTAALLAFGSGGRRRLRPQPLGRRPCLGTILLRQAPVNDHAQGPGGLVS